MHQNTPWMHHNTSDELKQNTNVSKQSTNAPKRLSPSLWNTILPENFRNWGLAPMVGAKMWTLNHLKFFISMNHLHVKRVSNKQDSNKDSCKMNYIHENQYFKLWTKLTKIMKEILLSSIYEDPQITSLRKK